VEAAASPAPAAAELEQIRRQWAREWWMRSQARINKLQTDLERGQQHQAQLETELHQAEQEKAQLQNRLSEFYDLSDAIATGSMSFSTVARADGQIVRVVQTDYSRLESLLAESQWKAADQETALLLLDLCDRRQEKWIHLTDIEQLPCAELRRIDNLWTTYSQNHFGFSIQYRIWQRLGGKPNAKYDMWCRFGAAVGWHHHNAWKSYDRLLFNLNAPQGSLPAAYGELGLGAERLYYWWWLVPVMIFSRLERCQS
jgi:hypothetical protein